LHPKKNARQKNRHIEGILFYVTKKHKEKQDAFLQTNIDRCSVFGKNVVKMLNGKKEETV